MSEFQLIKISKLEEILDSKSKLEKPMIVVFKWEECGVCKVNVPLIERMLKDKFNGKVYSYWIDVDSESIWAEDKQNSRWSINLAPTYHVYNKEKKLVFEHVAFLPDSQLENVLKEIK